MTKWTFNPFPLEFLASLRTAVYVTLIGVSLSPGMAVGDEEETGVPEGFAIFVHGDEPGHLEIDGSNLNAMLQLPEEPRHFYSADEFVEFAIQELNASVVLDESAVYRRTSTCCSTRPSAPRRTKRKAAGRSRPTFVGNGDSFPGSAARPAGGMSSG